MHKSNMKAYFEKQKGNYISSYEIVKFDDAEIISLEAFESITKSQVLEREQYFLDQNKDIIINKNKAVVNLKDYYQRADVKDRLKQYYNRPEVKARITVRAKVKSKDKIYCEICKCNVAKHLITIHNESEKHRIRQNINNIDLIKCNKCGSKYKIETCFGNLKWVQCINSECKRNSHIIEN